MIFFVFLKARFSKHLERFCSTLLLYTATMVWTSIKPRFHSGMSVTGLPRNQSSSRPEKIEKHTSELSCYEKSSQDEEFVART